MTDESFGSDSVHSWNAWLLCIALTSDFLSSFFFPFFLFLRKVLFETANAFAACLIFHLVPPLSLSASSATLYLSVSCFSSLFWLVEDVSNLTASDVMNRVNLGYLQGKTVCCV